MRSWIPTALLLLSSAVFSAPVEAGEGTDPAVAAKEAIPLDLIAKSWPMSFATAAEQEQWASTSRGWRTLFIDRNYALATQEFGADGGLRTARGHAEMAALYRQAALVSANAYIQAYGKTPSATDPVGAAHLLSVSYAITGDLEKARTYSKVLDQYADPTTTWHAPWNAWLASGAAWPPDLTALPTTLPEPTPGAVPELPAFPHYDLPEQGGSTQLVEMADPGALIALSLWHETTARSLAGGNAPWIDTYIARYRLPVEPHTTGVSLPNEMLFGSDFATPEDAAFMAALTGAQGLTAVDAYASKSLIAALVGPSRVNGKIDPDKALELTVAVEAQLIEQLKAKAGTEESVHAAFADIVQVGLLRNLALVAELEGNHEASGLLRGFALARSINATDCPTALLSLTAWDAGDRYVRRGHEILQRAEQRYPTVAAARVALDQLSTKVAAEDAKKSAEAKAKAAAEVDRTEVEDDEEIVVISDRFARWDGTRWYIKTEIGHPLGMTFYADKNTELKTNAFQIRTILACAKDFKLSKKLYEVSCTIEDFGIQAASRDQYGEQIKTFSKSLDQMSEKERKREEKKRKLEQDRKDKREAAALEDLTPEQRLVKIEELLEEIDTKLSGKSMQLQVRDDGRVTNIDLEGLTTDNQRERLMAETLRMVMSRVIVGFDMRLNKWMELKEGVWTEYTSALMSMPMATRTTQGTSVLLHRLSRMNGNLIVESVGKGVISLSIDNADNTTTDLSWQTNLNGVSVYDSHDGYMTERVWALSGKPTASAWGFTDYWHAGRIVQLKPEQKPSCGETQLVTPPGYSDPKIPAWTPLEE